MSTPELREQLQAHLGGAFVLERELGGGGMSRVFVADEVRLSRKVVIKVLSPELVQGINAERFEREILLAASLQQANIVGVLSAGEVQGLPYFIMPFVEGESLRARLTGSGLPIPDVLAIVRDVAKALGYAHSRGIVHRDIKPDNVLLSSGTAMVTDFGIAKALTASRTESGGTLTSIGTSIGTPAYMAPEQVAGDPNIDHRVDLYALGCLAYELLTGRSPYADRTPQKMLAAHLSEVPAPVSVLRADSPAPLNALVARLLQKDPAERMQSASEVLQALDAMSTTSSPTLALTAPAMLPKVLGLYVVATAAVAILAKAAVVGIGLPDWVFPGAVGVMLLGLPALLFTAYAKRVQRQAVSATPTLTPGGSMVGRRPSGTMATMALKASPHLSWRKTARGGVLAMAAFVVLVVAFMTLRALGIGPWGSLLAAGKLGTEDRIVLADLNASPEDSALAPIVVAAVRAALTQSQAVHLVPQTEIAGALEQMKLPKESRLNDPATVNQVAARTNAKGVLGGRLAHAGAGGYAISLELTAAQGGAVLASYQATATMTDLLDVVDGLTRKLRGKVGESLRQVQRSIPLQQATTSSLEALRKYSEASVANDVEGDYDRAVRLCREAVALDSTFALAWRKMAVALNNGSGSAAAKDSASQKAFQYADRLPDREKYLVIGVYYNRSEKAADRGKTVAAYQAAYAADSNSSIAANNLATLYGLREQWDSAIRYARRQLAIDHNHPAVTYLADALTAKGDVDQATVLLDSLHKALPKVDTFDGVQSARYLLLMARGRDDSLRKFAAELSASPVTATRIWGLGYLLGLELTAGQLKQAEVTDKERDALRVSRGAAIQVDGLATAYLDIRFRGRNADGVRLLDSIVAGRQWSSGTPSDRPYFDVGSLYADAGRADRAREILSRFDAESPRARAPASRPYRMALQAAIALAEKKYDEAVRLFVAADTAEDGLPWCSACVEFDVGRTFDAAGKPDSAIAHFTAYLATPQVRRNPEVDARARPMIEKRLGELYDARKDKNNALKHYGAFVDLWKGADAELQPLVTTVKKRMGELATGEGKSP